MMVCKFFLQGTCKFGDFCKFDHQLTDNFSGYQNSTSILRQSQFGNTPQQPKPATNPSNVDTNTLVKSVVNDMTVAEKGGQWLLSCYAPFKEKPAFPGFEDHSFEEIRLGYYEAAKNGTVEQYKQQVQIMLQQAIMRLKSLQTPSPDIVNLLKCIYNIPPASHCGVYGSNTVSTTTPFGNNATYTTGSFNQQQSSPFVQQTNSSMFAQPNQNMFGKPSQLQQQNQFSGASGSIFGGGSPQSQVFKPQTNTIFGNAQTQNANTGNNIFQQANSGFGNQAGNSIFGGVQPTTAQTSAGSIFSGQSIGNSIFSPGQSSNSSVFAGQQMTNSSIFGGQQNNSPTFVAQPQVQQSSGNVFANTFAAQSNNSTFGQNIFGGGSNVQVSQPFGGATTQTMPQQSATNIFGNQLQSQTPQNPVFAQQQPSIFSPQDASTVYNQQSANSPFSQPSSVATDAKSHSSSIFGNSQNTVISSSPFGQTQQVDETVYSKLEELTEEEIKWFESDDLDILKIPEKTPTFQMCFKT